MSLAAFSSCAVVIDWAPTAATHERSTSSGASRCMDPPSRRGVVWAAARMTISRSAVGRKTFSARDLSLSLPIFGTSDVEDPMQPFTSPKESSATGRSLTATYGISIVPAYRQT